ncbi:MAG: type II secretion system F family protein [Candidatus Brockarchaeota archaeon]|nr:type II secretion system F family protein [Candidatus Brockarchaeota archaeon]
MSLTGFATMMFGSLGDSIAKLCGDLEASGIRIYPRAYGSLVLFATFITAIVSVVLSSVFVVSYTLLSINLGFGEIYVIPLLLMSLPVIVFLIGISWPKIKISGIKSSLSAEVPYAAAYTAVMSTGGISPYVSIMRLSRVPLLPTFSKTAKLLDLMVRGLGYDPVTALEECGKKLPSKEFRELLLGYASTLKTGGDVVHYLLRRTELLFQERLETLKMIGGRLGQMMEVYIVVAILLLLGIYTIYAVQLALSQVVASSGGLFENPMVFALFSYVFLPFFSVVFLWLIDALQPKYPMEDNSPYAVFAATATPMLLILLPGFFLSSLRFTTMPGPDFSLLAVIPPFNILNAFIDGIRKHFNLEAGYDASIGLILALIFATIPAVIYRTYINIRERGMDTGFANFLRDLVEIRKSGLSPEKCIINLSERNYGNLSRHIKTMATQISWGVGHAQIYKTFSKRVRSWLTKISMFLLLDAIEVGGGTPETLETLAQFNESIILMEKEKRSELRPLLLIPYIGTGVLVIVVVALLTFFRAALQMAGKLMNLPDMIKMMLPPIVVHVYLMGLVGGKIAYGETSSGFLHAVLLLIFMLVIIILAPIYSFGVIPTGGATIG